ncbi:hypothetical protein AVEN_175306-1 [Araneus ventricosus]|uniref:Uncharacterized protein n=1 Tax=Araneus ventricosus TaxID=182803 RepID=A0A4Y2GG24_ARAVE|nr:hypothetical protein AVEN_175306-1 [Araneus ventricosus]
MPSEDKYKYLIQVITSGTRAANFIESFPPTAQNYPKAIELLKERFGREDLLVQVYVRELLKMAMKNAVSERKCADLTTLYDQLESHIRPLDNWVGLKGSLLTSYHLWWNLAVGANQDFTEISAKFNSSTF